MRGTKAKELRKKINEQYPDLVKFSEKTPYKLQEHPERVIVLPSRKLNDKGEFENEVLKFKPRQYHLGKCQKKVMRLVKKGIRNGTV